MILTLAVRDFYSVELGWNDEICSLLSRNKTEIIRKYPGSERRNFDLTIKKPSSTMAPILRISMLEIVISMHGQVRSGQAWRHTPEQRVAASTLRRYSFGLRLAIAPLHESC